MQIHSQTGKTSQIKALLLSHTFCRELLEFTLIGLFLKKPLKTYPNS
jgi:hypothetical protein